MKGRGEGRLGQDPLRSMERRGRGEARHSPDQPLGGAVHAAPRGCPQQNHFLLPPCLCLRTGNAGMKESLRNSAGSKLVAAEGRGQGQWRGTAHGYRVSFWGAGNVLDLEVVVAQH